MITKIFIISLPNSKRIETIKENFSKYQLNIDIFYGVDGRIEDLSKYDIDTKTPQRFWHNYISCCSYKHKLTNTEYGCALSHVKLYEHIVKNNIPISIIFEDDMFPSCESFNILLNNINDIQSILGFDILFLVYIDQIRTLLKTKVVYKNLEFNKIGNNKLDWLINRRKTCYLTGCYVLTLKGAQKLLEKAYPIRMPADRLTGLIAYNKLNAWKINTPIIATTNATSTITHHTGN